MKKFGAILSLLALISQSTALAWIGGPYSNNTYDGFDGGVFSGTIRGSRCTGLFRFSQGAEAYVSPFGDSIVYFKGMTYYGESYGFIDTVGGSATGVTNGQNSGNNTGDPGGSNFRNNNGTGFGVSNGVGTTVNAGGAAINQQFGNINSAAANASWNGKITSKRPTIRFKGKGEISFFGLGGTISTYESVESTGDFFEPRVGPGGEALADSDGTRASVTTRDNDFPKFTDVIKIKVTGGRVSTTPFFGPAEYQG